MRWVMASVTLAAIVASCGGGRFSSGDRSAGSSGSGGAAGEDGEGGDGQGDAGDGNGTGNRGGAGGAAGSAGAGGEELGGSAGASGATTGGSGGSTSSGGSATGGDAGDDGQGGAGSGGGGAAGSGGVGGNRPVFIELLADGFVRTVANAVSADGTHIAGQGTVMGGYIRALRWTEASVLELGTDVGWIAARGLGISDDGSVVAGYVDTQATALAFRWEDGMMELPPLVRGDAYAQALDVSGDGSVVVGVSIDGNGDTVPVQWTGSSVQQLPVLAEHSYATPTAVDGDAGLIVGTGVTLSNFANDAVRWPANGVFSLGIPNSEVFDVSADGRYVVGTYLESVMPGTPQRIAFRWSASELLELPQVGTGTVDCLARAVSGDGAVVAGRCTEFVTTLVTRWYLWSEATGVVLLEQVLAELDVDTSRYTNWEITGVSRDGTAIVGNADRNGIGLGWRAIIGGVFP